MSKLVYAFEEGSKELKNLLGGKGANLSEMTNIGLPVPPGFTLSTEACNEYYEKGKILWDDLKREIEDNMKKLEAKTGKKFGSEKNPLLVSVRSGAAISMPGMMDTVLNLGLNDVTAEAIAKETGNERFTWDSYRRFIQMFSDVVMEIPKYKFEIAIDELKESKGYNLDVDMTAQDLKDLVSRFKSIYIKEIGKDFPEDPFEQLLQTILAVFDSWNNPRAIVYRELNDIPGDIGTGVNVQSMVFGNMGENSGTGVAFTRDPATGENIVYGEYLMNAQGEDVVAGIRTPHKIERLKDDLPEVYGEFLRICSLLENHYKNMQDIEFTIEKGKLYILQTRNGKRTSTAAVQIAVDMVEEGLLSKEEAILRVDPQSISQMLHKAFREESLANARPIAEGLPASPGAASGKVFFNSESIKLNKGGILVRLETSPEDIEGMHGSEGILTVRGGMTSHAAVVARGMGKCCVSGCSNIKINEEKKEMTVGDVVIKEGEYISLDGTTGKVYLGSIEKEEASLGGSFKKFMEWADEIRVMGVRTNADTPEDSEVAIKFGAEGIGLCRTEHMFFEEKKIWPMREMIVAKTTYERERALDKLLPLQKEDFVEIFRVMGSKPVTVRLLDPPLHEFLPNKDDEIKRLADDMNLDFDELKQRVFSLHEFNPMLGHRGCRLAITYPEIYEMQAKAIIGAAIQVRDEGIEVDPEIMIPLVGEVNELKYVKSKVIAAIDKLFEELGESIKYKLGTMIEVPRACLTSDEIAEEADFFSFGTNDLTQITFGFSRDDSPKFLGEYKTKEILPRDPFESVDTKGVGKLIKMSIELGQSVKKDIKLGVCGEHGGDPKSIEFFHSVGLNYVSCSPYRVPVARLAAAQAELKSRKK
ncbi:pyruvate, phosphate dikinase [uncultured Ilyobacter sp.]|jgi:pyruvate,orthophosphate dikinase|uniref:pyruvate, phosphate dikinase n=1 Tax=uncultured Ilyobacter sp. TaxID=544433 RepID=UPI0029C08727|nr:pyruvate, phosphate dikinase [uncultured Ilyobacter sp.]